MPLKDSLRPTVAVSGMIILFGLLAVASNVMSDHSPFVFGGSISEMIFITIGILSALCAVFLIVILVYLCVRRVA